MRTSDNVEKADHNSGFRDRGKSIRKGTFGP